MSKHGPLQNAIEYWAARTLVFGLSSLPLPAAAWVGRRLGDLMRIVDKRHRTRAREQVADRLGLSGKELDNFVKENFQSYGMTLAEFAHLPKMNQEDFLKHTDVTEVTNILQELKSEGKGVIIITAHFGNWEWSNALASSFGIKGGSIARPLDNPRVNEYVRSIRERNGLKILDKQGAIRKALGQLKQGNFVAVLIDQDAGPKGTMSPFLGKPASTITVPIELSIRTGCPMIIVTLKRNPVGSEKRFTLQHSPNIYHPNQNNNHKQETLRLLNNLNNDLSTIIHQTPTQWFWIHRRWKTQNTQPGE